MRLVASRLEEAIEHERHAPPGEIEDLDPHPRQLAARANARVVSLDVGGMTCSGCAARVKGELAAVPGVSAVEVRLQDERAVVVCDPAVADSALVSAVHRAGPGFTAAPAMN